MSELLNVAEVFAATLAATIAAPARANYWPSMRDALAYCRSGDVDPRYAMDGRRLLTDKQCARRFLKDNGPHTHH